MHLRFKFLVLLLLCCSFFNSHAQLFAVKNFYMHSGTVKSKFYNGSGKGYWRLEKLDTLGRVVIEENYRKNVLLDRMFNTYNGRNDKVKIIYAYSINNPNRVDSVLYDYKYDGDFIIAQKQINRNDTTTISLTERQGDSVLTYLERSTRFNKSIANAISTNRRIIATTKAGRMDTFRIVNDNDRSTETKIYEYYPDGKLKRRTVKRDPEIKDVIYTGSPGSDDMGFIYKFDSKGRVKEDYVVVDGKTFKRVAYVYKK